jgi:hypothetical protein
MFTERRLAHSFAAGSLLALAALFWPAVLRRMYVYGDLGSYLLPMRIFLAESLERGITPLWMPDLFCGYYAHGEGPIGIFHPVRWLLYRFLPISEAFNLECLIPYPLALAGMALFARRIGLPPSAALFGGASFAFSAYMTGRLTHANAIAVIAHVGWLLFAIDLAVRESGPRRRRAWLAIALVTASQLLVGYPVAIVYCWLIALPYALFAAAQARRLAGIPIVATALATGVLIAGIQVVPTLDHMAGSQRAHPTYDFLTAQSLHPLNLLTVVAPWLYRIRLYADGDLNPVEQALYFGPVVPIAAAWVLLRWRELDRYRSLVAGLLAISALALVLALGKHTGLYRWIVELPVIGVIRVPSRFSAVLFCSGALFAAIAFADLERGDPSPRRRRSAWWIWLVPAASWIAAGLALVLRDPAQGWARFAQQQNSVAMVVLGPLVFAVAAALFTAAVRGHRAALFGLVALALTDHVGYGASLWWYDPPQTLDEFRADVLAPPEVAPQRVAAYRDFGWDSSPERPWRWWSSTQWIVHGAQLVSGYAGLMPAKRLDYEKPASLRVASASVLAKDWFRHLPGALSRARMVASAQQSAEPAVDIEAIDVATTALVDEPVDLEPGPAGVAAIQRYEPGAIRIASSAPTRQLLVVAESYHPGWRVSVDGTEARVLRVNGDFLGVTVGAGAHEVELRFAPRSFTIGCWTSLAGSAIAAAVALAGRGMRLRLFRPTTPGRDAG